jgi:hypothetical protein
VELVRQRLDHPAAQPDREHAGDQQRRWDDDYVASAELNSLISSGHCGGRDLRTLCAQSNSKEGGRS